MLLLSLPRDYDPAVFAELAALDKTVTGEVMHYFHAAVVARYGAEFTTWACSPVNQPFIDEKALAQFPNLRILATASTGTNHIDLDACAARGIKVLSLLDDRAGLNTISASAEWTFKLILDGLRLKKPYHELQGLTVGLVGWGRIGKLIQLWAGAFGAIVPYKHDPYDSWALSGLDEVFTANVVVICCALTDETRGMITYDLLRRLPPDAVLVNTARGEVINENDLCRFMAARPDVRVCLDVVTGEVNGTANPERLRALGALVTDHIAGETYESRTKAARIILGLLKKEMVKA